MEKVEVQLRFELRVRVWQEHRDREKNGNLKRGECFSKDLEGGSVYGLFRDWEKGREQGMTLS